MLGGGRSLGLASSVSSILTVLVIESIQRSRLLSSHLLRNDQIVTVTVGQASSPRASWVQADSPHPAPDVES